MENAVVPLSKHMHMTSMTQEEELRHKINCLESELADCKLTLALATSKAMTSQWGSVYRILTKDVQ